jgi:hypothetical protein
VFNDVDIALTGPKSGVLTMRWAREWWSASLMSFSSFLLLHEKNGKKKKIVALAIFSPM